MSRVVGSYYQQSINSNWKFMEATDEKGFIPSDLMFNKKALFVIFEPWIIDDLQYYVVAYCDFSENLYQTINDLRDIKDSKDKPLLHSCSFLSWYEIEDQYILNEIYIIKLEMNFFTSRLHPKYSLDDVTDFANQIFDPDNKPFDILATVENYIQKNCLENHFDIHRPCVKLYGKDVSLRNPEPQLKKRLKVCQPIFNIFKSDIPIMTPDRYNRQIIEKLKENK
ncbi:hypothetical protein CYY_004612 [Polysphondylium violaceum]|uniref:Uncharacterized protein n=1 Tax=Polysphondylium violaceum TaxID=133409 RepID=A0A8J4V089_9MYCE|nr:hypothetical protein CYY_004612 [Polysphondylium violaceum]